MNSDMVVSFIQKEKRMRASSTSGGFCFSLNKLALHSTSILFNQCLSLKRVWFQIRQSLTSINVYLFFSTHTYIYIYIYIYIKYIFKLY